MVLYVSRNSLKFILHYRTVLISFCLQALQYSVNDTSTPVTPWRFLLPMWIVYFSLSVCGTRRETLAASRGDSRCAGDLVLRPSLSPSSISLRSKADNAPFLRNIWGFDGGEYSGCHLLGYDTAWSLVHRYHRSWTTCVMYWIRYTQYFQLMKVLSRVFWGVWLLTGFRLDDWIYCTYTLNS
jgi:hypothetical protein